MRILISPASNAHVKKQGIIKKKRIAVQETKKIVRMK